MNAISLVVGAFPPSIVKTTRSKKMPAYQVGRPSSCRREDCSKQALESLQMKMTNFRLFSNCSGSSNEKLIFFPIVQRCAVFLCKLDGHLIFTLPSCEPWPSFTFAVLRRSSSYFNTLALKNTLKVSLVFDTHQPKGMASSKDTLYRNIAMS